MDRVSALLAQYRTQLSLPWRRDIAGAERVWLAVYPPELERMLRPKIPEFELATKAAGYKWRQVDLTRAFSTWLVGQEYCEAYFQDPDLIAPALDGFSNTVEAEIRETLSASEVDDQTVVALFGVASLFPMARVSTLVQRAAHDVRGRLLVFFPGALERGNYRLLDARDGWNYLAIPIQIPEGTNR